LTDRRAVVYERLFFERWNAIGAGARLLPDWRAHDSANSFDAAGIDPEKLTGFFGSGDSVGNDVNAHELSI